MTESHKDKVCPYCNELMIYVKNNIIELRSYTFKNTYVCLGCGYIENIEENKQ